MSASAHVDVSTTPRGTTQRLFVPLDEKRVLVILVTATGIEFAVQEDPHSGKSYVQHSVKFALPER